MFCTEHNVEMCTLCDDGYHLIGNKCVENECFCDFGGPATGADCEQNELKKCEYCDDGYGLIESGKESSCLFSDCRWQGGSYGVPLTCPNGYTQSQKMK